MPSELDLVNIALAELGRPVVTSLSDNESAQLLGKRIETLAPIQLLSYNWNFAIKYRSDNTPLVDNFSEDFVYTYNLPGDYGKFYKWASIGNQHPSYQIVDGLLQTNEKPIKYYYIINNAGYEILPSLYAYALAIYAASELCLVLTNNIQLTSYLKQKHTEYINKAILENDMERAVTSMPYNDFDRTTFV